MQYNTRTNNADIKKVEGKKIILKEYPEIECYGYDDGLSYYVCELSTGTGIGRGYNQKTAKLNTIENLKKAGTGKFRKMIAENIEDYGYANKRTP